MPVINRLQSLIAEKGERERRTITVVELSEATEINRQTIHDWKNNTIKRFDADVIEAFLKYFQCGISDLLVYEPDKPSDSEREPA